MDTVPKDVLRWLLIMSDEEDAVSFLSSELFELTIDILQEDYYWYEKLEYRIDSPLTFHNTISWRKLYNLLMKRIVEEDDIAKGITRYICEVTVKEKDLAIELYSASSRDSNNILRNSLEIESYFVSLAALNDLTEIDIDSVEGILLSSDPDLIASILKLTIPNEVLSPLALSSLMATCKNYDVILHLIENGNVPIRNAIYLAAVAGCSEILGNLLKYQPQAIEMFPLLDAGYSGGMKTLEIAVQHHLKDPNLKEYVSGLIVRAQKNRNLPMIKYLGRLYPTL